MINPRPVTVEYVVWYSKREDGLIDSRKRFNDFDEALEFANEYEVYLLDRVTSEPLIVNGVKGYER